MLVNCDGPVLEDQWVKRLARLRTVRLGLKGQRVGPKWYMTTSVCTTSAHAMSVYNV